MTSMPLSLARERAEVDQDRRDALILRVLPAVERAARTLYGGDAFARAAWARFTWAIIGDDFGRAVADALYENCVAEFSDLDRDVWHDCVEHGDVRTFVGLMAARRMYHEAAASPDYAAAREASAA